MDARAFRDQIKMMIVHEINRFWSLLKCSSYSIWFLTFKKKTGKLVSSGEHPRVNQDRLHFSRDLFSPLNLTLGVFLFSHKMIFFTALPLPRARAMCWRQPLFNYCVCVHIILICFLMLNAEEKAISALELIAPYHRNMGGGWTY